MILIQIIVILAALALIVFALVGRQTHAARAWKKIALCILAIGMIIAVLFPDLTNQAARLVGVGRGADLLLYVLVLAFIGYILNNYTHQQKDKDVVYRLARRVALLEAANKYKPKKSK